MGSLKQHIQKLEEMKVVGQNVQTSVKQKHNLRIIKESVLVVYKLKPSTLQISAFKNEKVGVGCK
jgi:hypothetical protein